jgi:hypothetical protein
MTSSASELLQKSGYVVFPELISAKEAKRHLNVLLKFWDEEQRINPKFSKRFPQLIVNNLPVRTRDFDPLLEHSNIMALGKEFLGDHFILGEMRACNVEKCDKVAFVHRDGHIPTHPGYPLAIVTMWTLEDFSAKNGGTIFYPGTHRLDYRPNAEILKNFTPMTFEAPAGSLLVFDANLWHGPSINSTGDSRWSLNSYYARWFMKPTFDMAARFSKEEFRKLTPAMKQLLGFSSQPPRDETKTISTLIPPDQIEDFYPFSK